MANGIGRLRTMGIAAQPTFGSAESAATFVLPLTNAPEFSGEVQKALNEAALGNGYQVNDIVNTVRLFDQSLEFKADVEQIPLLFKQRFSFTSGTVSGETTVYEHVGSFENTTQTWYTLFLQDDQRNDYVVRDVLFGNHDITFDNDFVRFSSQARGAYPVTGSVTNTVTQPDEFVGRMVKYQEDDAPEPTVTTTRTLTVNANFSFGLNSEDTAFGVGDADLQNHELTSDKYMFTVNRLKSGITAQEDDRTGQIKAFKIISENTDKFVTGSAANTRPYFEIDVPRGKLESYTEEPDRDELIRESLEYTALKPAGVSGTPCSITVRNSTASY